MGPLAGAEAATLTLSQVASEDPLDADDIVTPAELLDVTLEFSVNGGGNRLTLTVSNETDLPDDPLLLAPFNSSANPNNAYFVTALYFNANEDIEGLTLSKVTRTDADGSKTNLRDWELDANLAAAEFGTFDFALAGDVGANATFLPGSELTFVFDIQAGATVLKPSSEINASDFIDLSTGTNERAFTAAKFAWAPEDQANPNLFYDPNNPVDPGSLAPLGDPTSFDFDAAYGAVGPLSGIVPEPDSGILFAVGALVAALVTRRRSLA
jgi:hypothetical protein